MDATAPGQSFADKTQSLLEMLSKVTSRAREAPSPVPPSQLAQWRSSIRQAREYVTTDAEGTLIVQSLTHNIQILLRFFLENELVNSIRAVIYARTEEGFMLDIAKLMLIRLEKMLEQAIRVGPPSYSILCQMFRDITLI